MNQHSIEALIAPMIAAMQETIRHMSELVKEIDNQQTVSYTHLDVYKRQGQRRHLSFQRYVSGF